MFLTYAFAYFIAPIFFGLMIWTIVAASLSIPDLNHAAERFALAFLILCMAVIVLVCLQLWLDNAPGLPFTLTFRAN